MQDRQPASASYQQLTTGEDLAKLRGGKHSRVSQHLGLQQRPACPASSSERACSSSEAAISPVEGTGRPV